MPARIRQGDTVQVVAGREKGKKGPVMSVITDSNRVLVRGVNIVKRHTRPTQKNPQGGIEDKEAPLHVSNVMIVDPQDSRPTRVRLEERDGSLVRVSVRTGTLIPTVTKTKTAVEQQ